MDKKAFELSQGWILPTLIALISGCATTNKVQFVETVRLEVTQTTNKEGAQVVVTERKIEKAETNVIEQSNNVKTVTKITGYDVKDKDKTTIGRFDLSPDGSRIVMAVLRESNGSFSSQLWSIGKDGGAATKITEGNYKDMDPSYSRSGKHIYFVTNRGDTRFKIWRIQSSGVGGLTKVSSGSTVDRVPSESPDSERLTYQSLMDGDERWQVWSSATTGALPTQMTLGASPVYSPDGSKILYLKADESSGKRHIWFMDADGSNRTQLTDGDNDEETATWSPNGKQIVYSSNAGHDASGKKNFDVYSMNIDGTGKTQLTTNGSVDIQPVMDMAGKHIYFLSNRGGAWNIWRMELVAMP